MRYGIFLVGCVRPTRLMDQSERVLSDPRIGQLFRGGAMTESAA
jgi:branched-chain amino acid transport system ATP-binding protein